MATKTVAAGGGNFSAGATWVGGVAPIASDDIVANATSGNLTLTANTVGLIGANFTGYTGTLALGNFSMLITITGGSVTFSPSMTITTGTGFIRMAGLPGISTTVTTNGLVNIPTQFNSQTATVTLTDTLTTSRLATSTAGIITGSDVIFTGTTQPGNMAGLNMRNPSKFIFRPSATLTLSGQPLPQGWTVFDSTQTITINQSAIEIGTFFSPQTKTIEFARGTTWSGSGTTNGKPHFYLDASANAAIGSTLSFITTEPQRVSSLDVFGPPSSMALSFTGKFLCDSINLRAQTTQLSGALNTPQIFILGSGGFSASNVMVELTRPLLSSRYYSGGLNVKLSGDATYSVSNLSIQGSLSQPGTTGTASVQLSSITASVPATISILNGAYASTNITDIYNIGRTQYALTNGNNTLTRTIGFVPNVEGSFTFVN